MNIIRRGTFWRKLKIGWRDTLLLFREFRQPIFLFLLTIIGFGWIYYLLAQSTHEPITSLPEAIYLVLTLTFLQSSGSFPKDWFLQAFFFIMPIVGIAILAYGLADFGTLFFNRKARSKEWEMAVASTFKNHIVLLGLGHLGYRVVVQLLEFQQNVVVIELEPKRDLVEKVRSLGVPVIQDDGTREVVLKSAGVEHARSIVLCMQDDSLNLQIALKARGLNPRIQVILRIFDDDFAESLQKQFGFKAISATGMAAPIFASAATNIDMTPPLIIDNQPNSLAQFKIDEHSRLVGKTIQEIEDEFTISVVFIMMDGHKELHPKGSIRVSAGDTLAILGEPGMIHNIIQNHKD